MGAGRKTETYTLAPNDGQYYGTMNVRNLKKGDLCAVIFGAKFSTIKECYAKKLFGLPAPHMAYIKNIDPGLTLFLFNYSDRTLHGVFKATSQGQLNIDPKAWSPNGTDPSPYAAQVSVEVRINCEPLSEEVFGPVIAENYQDDKIFWFELDRGQTNKLLSLFKPSPSGRRLSMPKDAAAPVRKAIPASSLVEIGASGAPNVGKWSSLFKEADGSTENKGKELKESGVASKANGKQIQYPTQNRPAAPANIVTGPSKKPSDDTCSEIDWDAQSNFKPHLEGLNRILDDPMDDINDFNRFDANVGFPSSSSSLVRNHWEDEELSADKSPCGSSYVSANTGDIDIGDRGKFNLEQGSSAFVDILTEILAEVKELRINQMKQAEYMISLEMDQLESRKEILRLKARNGSS